jgi:dihydroxyacetone kinase-like protein
VKKLVNDPADYVSQSMEGFALAHPDLVRLHRSPMFLTRADPTPSGKVAILSGGGSGHEPMHAGFVGVGMLDAAVPGPVFTSPSPDPVVAATHAVDAGGGVLYLVKNYTGDVLNFETAADLAQADGVRVNSVIIDDDVAVRNSLYTAGRRGVAGTVLVEKIAGAAAERGDDLAEVTQIARRVAASARSMGVALSSPTVPHSGRLSFELGDDEVELGIGIHAEPGRERIAFAPADSLTDRVLDAVLDDLSAPSGSRFIALVNGMGATPSAELHIVFRRVAERLAGAGHHVSRALVGSYATSLDMQGFSITLLPADDDVIELWDAPVRTAALRWRA